MTMYMITIHYVTLDISQRFKGKCERLKIVSSPTSQLQYLRVFIRDQTWCVATQGSIRSVSLWQVKCRLYSLFCITTMLPSFLQVSAMCVKNVGGPDAHSHRHISQQVHHIRVLHSRFFYRFTTFVFDKYSITHISIPSVNARKINTVLFRRMELYILGTFMWWLISDYGNVTTLIL